MNSRKGLSQVLYLIIAAAVLMMVGLSLVFSFTSGTDTSAVSAQACLQSLRAQCTTAPTGTEIDLPSSCTTTDNNGNPQLISGVDSSAVQGVSIQGSSSYTCQG